MLTPANGQFDVVFPQVSATGPQNTNVTNGERLLSAVLLSNNLGLPGPGTWERITEIGCQGLGILNTYNPDQQQKAKFETARRLTGVGGTGTPSRVGWPYTIQPFDEVDPTENSILGSVLTPSLLGLAYALPGTQTKISKLPRVKGDLTVHALQPYAAAVPAPTPPATTPPASPAYPPAGAGLQYAMYLETARDIDGGYAAQLLAAAGVKSPVTRHVNHNADAAVASGSARAAQYTGMPQGPKT
jgi:hypothetical protein